ncbi:MAG: insulinase family protein, partial [Opitutae bacterium]
MKTYLFKCMISVLAISASFLLLSCGVQRHDTISFPSNDANSSDNNHSSMQVIKRTLENGLTVYLSPNHEEPRFYAEIITRAGSKHDPATNTGLAHYLEHLLFKGT